MIRVNLTSLVQNVNFFAGRQRVKVFLRERKGGKKKSKKLQRNVVTCHICKKQACLTMLIVICLQFIKVRSILAWYNNNVSWWVFVTF